MTTTINASPTNGLVQTADGSGVLKVQSNGVTTNALAWGSYGFVGAGVSPTLKSAYNISSFTRNSSGDYTIAFATPLSDANYSAVGTVVFTGVTSGTIASVTKSTTSVNFKLGYVLNLVGGATGYDYGIDFSIFGN